MAEVAWPKELDEPDELGEIHGAGGTATRAAPATNNASVLMGSNSHDALWARYLQGLWPVRAIADEPYE